MSTQAANSVTIADYAQMSNQPLVAKIAFALLENASVLADMPFKPYRSLLANGSRFTSAGLPTASFRAVNDVPAVTKGVPKAFQESAYILSNQFIIDQKILSDVNQISDPMALQLSAWIKSAVYKINDSFINGTHASDANGLVGLRYRLDNGSAYDIPSEMKISGASLDISAGANGDGAIELIQQALDLMGSADGSNVCMYMSALLRRKIDRAIRKLGAGSGFETTTDAYGRRVLMFQNAQVKTIGRKADNTTEILPGTEASTGADGSSTFSSMYLVKYGEEDFCGWEFEPLSQSVIGPFLDTASGTAQKIVVDWAAGFYQAGIRSAARIYGWKTS